MKSPPPSASASSPPQSSATTSAYAVSNCRRSCTNRVGEPYSRGEVIRFFAFRGLMTLKATITEDMKAAMRARETARLSTIRLLLAAIKQKEVDERIEMSDTDMIGIIDKMIKQRRESIAHFNADNKPELSTAEQTEIEILRNYLPQPLS